MLSERDPLEEMIKKGRDLTEKHEFEKALMIYQAGRKEFPDDHRLAYFEAASLHKLERYEEAQKCCDEMMSLFDNWRSQLPAAEGIEAKQKENQVNCYLRLYSALKESINACHHQSSFNNTHSIEKFLRDRQSPKLPATKKIIEEMEQKAPPSLRSKRSRRNYCCCGSALFFIAKAMGFSQPEESFSPRKKP